MPKFIRLVVYSIRIQLNYVKIGLTLLFSTNKTDCPYITEILLKVALNTITLTLYIKVNEVNMKMCPV
jgi:hypothetical protein